MYRFPPLVASASTPALIIGTVAVNVIAAPAAGKQIRIVSIDYGLSRSVAAGAIVDATFGDAGGANIIARTAGGLSLAGTAGGHIVLPEPGVQITAVTAFELRAASTAANGTVNCVVRYYIDDVT